MNYNNFSKWFAAQLLPNIPSQSLIFMDNAKYHNLYVEDALEASKTLKAELQQWLKSHHAYQHDMLKPELSKKMSRIMSKTFIPIRCNCRKGWTYDYTNPTISSRATTD